MPFEQLLVPQLRRGVHAAEPRTARRPARRRAHRGRATTAPPSPSSPAAATSWATTWTGTSSTPPTTSSSTSPCPDGTRVMGLAGAPYLLMLGMNSHGVGNVSNSVHSNDNRIGVPNVFVRRWTLEARDARGGAGPGPARRPRARHQPVLRRHRRAGSGTSRRRPRAHALMDHTGGRLHGAHQPLRRAGDAALRGLRRAGVAHAARDGRAAARGGRRRR